MRSALDLLALALRTAQSGLAPRAWAQAAADDARLKEDRQKADNQKQKEMYALATRSLREILDLTMESDPRHCRSGGSYRYLHIRGDEEYGFHGSFHEVRPGELIVQTSGASGLGHLLDRSNGDVASILAVVAVIAVIGVAVEYLIVGTVDRRIRAKRGLLEPARS